ncbi:uncharacterized protein [Primulina huaijiensis]|uniref:uncharacterized protein n=1 Tax=Primulina huaijiensis TaxID=1492673 RepID=UPI003CC78B94
MIAMIMKKAFANIRDFAILAKISALFKLLMRELPIQRFPMVLTQFEERINMEMRESLGRNVLKHNVPASTVYDLLGSCFQEIVQGFELKTDAGLCYISHLHGKNSEKTDKFKHLKMLIVELDSFQLQKEKLVCL